MEASYILHCCGDKVKFDLVCDFQLRIMVKLFTVLIFSSIVIVVSGVFLSDLVQKVLFTKINDESNEYDFE